MAVEINGTSGVTVPVGSAGDPTAQIAVGVDTAKIQNGAVHTLSGPYYDITNIPPGIKKLTIRSITWKTNDTTSKVIRLGTSGGIQSTGYKCSATVFGATTLACYQVTDGFQIVSIVAADELSGVLELELHGTDTWVGKGGMSPVTRVAEFIMSGHKVLGGTLDRVRFTSVGGTATLSGDVSLSWEF